jgi:hypothetical protein
MKLCECGCGLPAPIADKTTTARGYVAGQPRRFVAGHFRPSRTTTGYPKVQAAEHPKAQNGCVPEHVIVAERALGRLIPAGAEIHHVDDNPRNNTNRNLVICQDKAYHKLLHTRARVVRAGGDPNRERICSTCRALKPFDDFTRQARNKNDGIGRMCGECRRSYNKTYVRVRPVDRRQACHG